MSFGESISTVFSKYATFSGRARRSEYWWWYLFVYLLGFVGGFITFLSTDSDGTVGLGGLVPGIIALAIFLPSLAVAVRRLHDTGRSGWWILIGLVPIIGFLVLLVFYVMDSGPDNQYGPNPKGRTVVTA